VPPLTSLPPCVLAGHTATSPFRPTGSPNHSTVIATMFSSPRCGSFGCLHLHLVTFNRIPVSVAAAISMHWGRHARSLVVGNVCIPRPTPGMDDNFCAVTIERCRTARVLHAESSTFKEIDLAARAPCRQTCQTKRLQHCSSTTPGCDFSTGFLPCRTETVRARLTSAGTVVVCSCRVNMCGR